MKRREMDQNPRSRLSAGVRLLPLLGLLLIAIGCTTAETAAEWHATFEDETGWQLSSDAVAETSVVDGVLQIHVFQPGQVAWATSESRWGDLHLTVEATQVSGPHDNEYGVLVRMDGDDRFYAFSISGDGYARVSQYADGTWTVLGPDWTPSEAIHQGAATNVLEVAAQGTTLEFAVNEQPVLQVEDTALKTGGVGLYAGAFAEGDVVVAFDNLSVKRMP